MTARRSLAVGLPLIAALGACATHVDPAFQAEQTRRALPACQALIEAYGRTRPGYVSLDEWTHAKWDRDLAKFDADHDGRIERSEYVDSIAGASAFARATLGRAFDLWDHGRKGYVDEADERRAQRFAFSRQDGDHDGWLSATECAHYIPAPSCFC